MVAPSAERMLFDGGDQSFMLLGRQGPTFSQDLTERAGAVDAPGVEGAQEDEADEFYVLVCRFSCFEFRHCH